MSEHQPRGQPLHEGANYPSPFTKVLALGYYDGPTEGLLQDGQGSSVYQFRMLAWEDETQDLRIFGLAPLPATAFAELAEAYARHQSPRWPVWVPFRQAGIEGLEQHVLGLAGPVEWVIATYDLLGEILAAKPAAPAEVGRITDWPSFLGLGKASFFRAADDLSQQRNDDERSR